MTEAAAPGAPYTLWGAAHSLYTGKVRSYLIKKGLAYRELYPSHPDFQARILPVVKAMVVPVLEAPDGPVIQDSDAIIDHLEALAPGPAMVPDTPVQRAVALLLNAFGSEYLLPLAMHYRWSYLAQQEHFLRAEFGRAIHTGPDRQARLAAGQGFMAYFGGFLPSLGVSEATIPAMEQSYLELLDALDAHFQAWPYLLGGRPSIADFGLMGPLYAHLGRDPVPATLMKTRAPNVYRWTERMNLAGVADGEFPDRPARFFDDDAIAPTLETVLALVFAHWTPGLAADAACFNAWAEHQAAPTRGRSVSHDGERRIHPTLGPIDYPWRGIVMRRDSAPHGLWLFDRATEAARGLEGKARARLDVLIQRVGGGEAMAIRLTRGMIREDGVLVPAD
jgi:glutathione S-transferase